MNTLLILGLSHSAQALVKLLLRDYWRVIATTRSPENAAHYAQKYNCEMHVFPNENLDALVNELPHVTHILATATPLEHGDPFLPFITGNHANFALLKWVGYLSTIGVYAEEHGGWVDELAPTHTSTPRIARRIMAELAWQEFATALQASCTSFRLGGIYGPHSNPFASLKAGTAQAIIKPHHMFNRIHVEDIAGAILHVMKSAKHFDILNIVDNEPTSQLDYMNFAATLLHLPAPPAIAFEDATLSPMSMEFYSRTKRVSNNRLVNELGYEIKYPSYREGLVGSL